MKIGCHAVVRQCYNTNHQNSAAFLSILDPVMACRLIVPKPLPKPMLTYCHLESGISVKFQHLKMSSAI